MEEEFLESDVVFSETYHLITDSQRCNTLGKKRKCKAEKHRTTTKIPNKQSSRPLDIPVVSNPFRYVDVVEGEDFDNSDYDNDDGYEDLEGKRLPPHLIIARRINNVNMEMACSFGLEDCKGRVLKGRNLFQVRNSILRLTGFIET